MGGRSSSSTSAKTENISSQVGFELQDESQAVGVVGSNNQITMTDQGAIDKAFNFAGEAANFVERSIQQTTGLIKDTTDQTLNAISQAQKTESQQGVDKITNYIPLALIVGGLVFVFKGN